MGAPNLQITVEPFESGKVVYLPMAPVTSQAKARGRVFLLLSIKNSESAAVAVQQVTVSFPNSSVSASTLAINMNLNSGQTKKWWFPNPADDIVFDLPGPLQIKIALKCSGFTTAKSFTYGLAAHVSPPKGGAYLFPAKASDLALGEFWQTNGCTHAMGSEGSQSFAYDMGVWGVDHDNDTYSWNLPGKNGTKNSDLRVWAKPIYAMADGKVLEAVNDCPNNPAPLTWSSQAELDQKLKEQKDNYWGSYPHGGAGNHFYIQHGDNCRRRNCAEGAIHVRCGVPGRSRHSPVIEQIARRPVSRSDRRLGVSRFEQKDNSVQGSTQPLRRETADSLAQACLVHGEELGNVHHACLRQVGLAGA